MITPAVYDAITNDLTDIFKTLENECIAEISKAVAKGSNITDATAWKMHKLSQVGVLKKRLTTVVAKNLQTSLTEVQKTVVQALKRNYEEDIKNLNDDSLPKWEDAVKTPRFQQLMQEVTATCKERLNYTGTTAVKSSLDAFKDTVNNAYLKALTGQGTYDQLTRKAVHTIEKSNIADALKVEGKNGLQVTYQTKSGKLYTTSLDSSIRRDIVTSIAKAGAEQSMQTAEELDTDLVVTSWHLGARPDHEVWQGKVFSLSGKSDKYPSFKEVCRYGEADGICGINCRHHFSPYREGQPINNADKPSAEYNNKQYALQQKQRGYERELRNLKRERLALKSGGADYTEVNHKLTALGKDYRSFIAENNLHRQTLRERI